MEGIIDANKQTVLSRKNKSEKKLKQQKEWQKRRCNRQRMAKSVNGVAQLLRFLTFVHLPFSVRSLHLFCRFTRDHE